MSTTISSIFSIFVLLGLFSPIIARSLMEEGSSADGPIGEDLPNNQGENPPFQRQRPNPPILFNTYLLEAFKVAEQLRDSQCTDDIMILNQSVSEHYCESNKTVYSFMNESLGDPPLQCTLYNWSYPISLHRQGSFLCQSCILCQHAASAANTEERSKRLKHLLNYTYELCSDVNLDSGDTILGHDFILYLRELTQAVELDVFFLRWVNGTPQPWNELVASRSIPVNASGWQVLNLKSVRDPFVESVACVDMYVGETNMLNQTTLLNKTQIAETFVLNDFCANENDNLPFVATYMYGEISLPPIFGKRSVGANHPNLCSRDTKCSVRYHRVNLNDYLPAAGIVYPQQVDVGQCGGVLHKTQANSWHHRQFSATDRQEGSTDSLDMSLESQYQCVPSKYGDLLVLRDIGGGELVLKVIPDFVITGCALQQCSSEI